MQRRRERLAMLRIIADGVLGERALTLAKIALLNRCLLENTGCVGGAKTCFAEEGGLAPAVICSDLQTDQLRSGIPILFPLPPFKSLALKPQRRHGPPGPGPEGPYARKK